MSETKLPGNEFCRQTFFGHRHTPTPLARKKHDVMEDIQSGAGLKGDLGLRRLFQGLPLNVNPGDKLTVWKNGIAVHEIPLAQMGKETVIGRHPTVDLQLESYKLALFHAVIFQSQGKYFVESLDQENGTLLNRRRLKLKSPVQLRDGAQVDIPGYRLEFAIADAPPLDEEQDEPDTEVLDDIPVFFYTPPPPPASPLLVNLIENREQLGVWSEGVTTVKVVDIIEETHDTKTFCFVNHEPMLFSYRPGQFITFILTIDGQEVKRSYSMSSSPSRPHLLEVTIKRVPGGLVSNWFNDHVKLGDKLTIRGPSGKFTCFDYPSNKMLFVGAGSGITPIVSMSRWIADTASDVDVKILASFKSPSDIIFRKEFELLAARKRSFQIAITLTSSWHGTDYWTGFTGRIDAEMLKVFVKDLHDRHVFMCGPEPFADGVKKTLQDVGFNMANLHTESFGSGRSSQGSQGGGRALELKGPLHKVTFAKKGITVDCDEHISVLELAEAHGIEIDYSCRIGSCGACEVKCKGDVNVSEDCEMDDKTKAAGFIYACCTRSLGDLELDV